LNIKKRFLCQINIENIERRDTVANLKISVLVENTVSKPYGVLAEWGLSMLLDFGEELILFDTGQHGSLINNALVLGIDLRKITKVVLSHGHYDHTGGLLNFLKLRGNVPVYAHSDLLTGHYIKDNGSDKKYIGIPFRLEQLESAGANFYWFKEALEINPNLWLSGEVPRLTNFEKGDKRLLLFNSSGPIKDPIHDDLSLFYKTDKGLIVILGCAHSGLVNIIEHARQVTGQNKIRAIIGGTHLGPVDSAQQEGTIEFLKSLDLECLAPNHCTGLPMASRLASEFPDQFRWAATGNILEL
jgi:7,8-dihydropterin-6-yl-methyl-4-(beta-D-ribofuranosyl)aminobenzene 5'-phosphate synthase